MNILEDYRCDLLAAQAVGVLDERFPVTAAYLGRLLERPALQRAAKL